MRALTALTLSILLGTSGYGFAQMKHAGPMDHGGDFADGALLAEPGQGAFAALSEVVSVLEIDPETDGTSVDLWSLSDHLVDMDRLVTNAEVTETELPNGIRAIASGYPKTIEILRRMVPARAAELASDNRWTVTAMKIGYSVVLTVENTDPTVTARIKGLGFFGLMASQDHHRKHHMMMARGMDTHRHQNAFLSNSRRWVRLKSSRFAVFPRSGCLSYPRPAYQPQKTVPMPQRF